MTGCGSHWLISQIPQCIRQISRNASFCNRDVHTCAHICYQMVHCGIWDWCIEGFMQLVGRQMERQAACKHHGLVSSGFKPPLFFQPYFVLWLLIHSVRNAVQLVPRIMHTILYWCIFMWLDSGKLCPCHVGFSHRHKCNLTVVLVPSNRKNMGKRLTKSHQEHTDGLMEDCSNSIANAME